MILPSSPVSAFVLLLLGAACWGLWANGYKLAGKWRFEMFLYDFAAGALLAAVIAAFTAGSFGPGDLTFADNLLLAGPRKMAYAASAGLLFTIGNMLLVGAVSLGGLTLAFLLSYAVASVFAVVSAASSDLLSNYRLASAIGLLITSAVLEVAAVVRGTAPGPGAKTGFIAARKPIALAALSGILIGGSFPLLNASRSGDNGLAPYSVALLFSAALFLATIVFNLYLQNLPVAGEPVPFGQYLRGTGMQHALGIGSGVLWAVGQVLILVSMGGSPETRPAGRLFYVFTGFSAILSAACGILFWRDMARLASGARAFAVAGLGLFAAGLCLVAFCPSIR